MVSVIITFMDGHIKYLKKNIESILTQTYQVSEILLMDHTHEHTLNLHLDKRMLGKVSILLGRKGDGFAQNYNRLIIASKGDFVFILNPDTILDRNCVKNMVDGIYKYKECGCLVPKIIRLNEDMNPYIPNIIDSAGLCIRPNIRHPDRGAGQIDVGQFDTIEEVFGATGAAMFVTRDCINNVTINGQYFDEMFWSYREDADISWRMQNYGWKCIYYPISIVGHVRFQKPGDRKTIPHFINMHSVKNRYLLMINNFAAVHFVLLFPFYILRDITVIGAVLLKEHSSLPAFGYIISNYKKIYYKRKLIQQGVKNNMTTFWMFNESSPVK